MRHAATFATASLAVAIAAFLGASVIVAQSPRGSLIEPVKVSVVETRTTGTVSTGSQDDPLAPDYSWTQWGSRVDF